MSSLPCVVSVVIKALNEERNIARAIESALEAIQQVGGEVILADSCSSDRTIDIASAYPITVVQLARPEERCCGAGPQLGYQHARGEFVYILDADMRLHPDFLKRAVAHLRAQPQLAGVAGQVLEHNTDSLEFRARVERGAAHMKAGIVDRLDMGGLYRREALESVGYFSNWRLHSYEEMDLALRLRAQGWQLERLDLAAVEHWGHDMSAYALLRRRWHSRYINGIGELVRAAWGQSHWPMLWAEVRELRLYVLVLSGLLAAMLVALLLACSGKALIAAGVVPVTIAALWGGLWWKKRQVAKATYALTSLLLHMAGLVVGFVSYQPPATPQVSDRVLRRRPTS